MNYFISKGGQSLGPYTDDQIRIFLQQGVVSIDDYVMGEGTSQWVPLRNVEALRPNASPTVINTQPRETTAAATDLIYAQGKEPVVACFLSLIIVGVGQFYNGDWAKGWFLLGTCIVASYFSCGTLWFGYALFSAIDAYRVAARLKPLNSWNWFA